jgi:protease YdgD
MLGGYQQDRPEVLLADTGCRLLGLVNGMLLHDCAGTRGASGAPLLMRLGETWSVLGVASRSHRALSMGEAVPASALPP